MYVYQIEFRWREESAYSRSRDYHLLLFVQNGNKMGMMFIMICRGTVDTNNNVNCWKTIWYNSYSHTKDYKAESEKLLVIPHPRDNPYKHFGKYSPRLLF